MFRIDSLLWYLLTNGSWPNGLARRLQQWAVKQFAHNWYLPCYQCTGARSYISSIQNYIYLYFLSFTNTEMWKEIEFVLWDIFYMIDSIVTWQYPNNKANGDNIGPTWVLSAPDGPHVGPMNLAIWGNSPGQQQSSYWQSCLEILEKLHTRKWWVHGHPRYYLLFVSW